MKSAFPPDMQLWPEGSPKRFINVDNRMEGTINGVLFRCEIKGDVAAISYIDPKDGHQVRVFQPHFSALGLLLAASQVETGEASSPEIVGLKPKPDGD